MRDAPIRFRRHRTITKTFVFSAAPVFLFLAGLASVQAADGQTLDANPSIVTFLYRAQQPLPSAVPITISSGFDVLPKLEPTLVSNPLGAFQISSAGNTLYIGLDPKVLGDLARNPDGGTYTSIVVVNA